MDVDLLIRDAQLRGRPDLTDIGIANGEIAAVAPSLAGEAGQVIEAEGRLVVPGFVDSHCHIDKSFFGRATHRYDYRQPPTRPAEDLQARYAGRYRSSLADYEVRYPNVVPILQQWAWKQAYTVDDVADRVSEALTLALGNGVTAMRMFVDVDTVVGLTAFRGVLEARRRFAGLMRLQVCAFPQEGLDADPGGFELLEQAMAEGADVVGGLPMVEWTDELSQRHVDLCFELARRHDADLHFLCDDSKDSFARALEYVAAKTLQSGWIGRVSSSHNGALSVYPHDHAVKVMNLLRYAQINICANTHVNLMGTVTRVHELVDLGVNVSIGQDDIDNFYYPFGRSDPLEWAWSSAHIGGFGYPEGIERVFDMLTVNGARTLRLDAYGLEAGCRADLVVLDCAHPRDAIQYQVDRTHVVSGGRLVATTRRERWVARPADG